jgi:PTS system ascorbate-specific IIB component
LKKFFKPFSNPFSGAKNEKLRIMTVCGFGLGVQHDSEAHVGWILKESNLETETFCADSTTAAGESFDIVFTSQEMAKLFDAVSKPVAVIDNFLSKEEIRTKGLEILKNAAGAQLR